MRRRLSGPVDEAKALDGLHRLAVNYDPADAPPGGHPEGWHTDTETTVVGQEPPGAPVPGGAWETACLLVRRYEFAEPRILRAVYRDGGDLDGRDMLLEGRFFGLRFHLGVRITGVLDETRESGGHPERRWGWSYQTLEGHLEEGRLSYEVTKDLATGQVSFTISGYSRRAPIPNTVVRWGFRVFGRWTQRRFYAAARRRLHRLVDAAQSGEELPAPVVRADGLISAPSGVSPHPLEHLAARWLHPGANRRTLRTPDG